MSNKYFYLFTKCINSLSNDKILDYSKLKAFADNKINVTQKLKYKLGRLENIVGKGGNAGHRFALCPQFFNIPLIQGHKKSGLCGKELIDE